MQCNNTRDNRVDGEVYCCNESGYSEPPLNGRTRQRWTEMATVGPWKGAAWWPDDGAEEWACVARPT